MKRAWFGLHTAMGLCAFVTSALLGGGPGVAADASQPQKTAATKPKHKEPPASPEIAPDGHVTFRLLAPKAATVVVSGEWPSGELPLGKGSDGVWSATAGPISPGLWGYSFVIDGVRVCDPGNRLLKPGRSPTSSALEIPGDALVTPDAGTPEGTVHVVHYFSRVLQHRRTLRVYTPPEYDDHDDHARRPRFPVLYLLHGFGDTEATWTEFGRADVMADHLIARKQAVPLIIVTPDGHAVPPDWDRWSRNVETFRGELVEDVVPFIDSHFRTQASPARRAVAGLSMGGVQAVAVGLQHPEVFAWVAGFSSAFWSPELFDQPLTQPAALNRALKLLWLSCGRDDFLIGENRSFVQRLQQAGVRHTWTETDGAHSWPVWRRDFQMLVPLLFRDADVQAR